MDKKKNNFKISLNEINTVENDPTVLKSKCIIFDFEKSGNNAIISKEVAEENINTLVGKRISCRYIRREDNDGEDALGSHEQYEGIDRDGNESIRCNTEAIGFIEKVYIDTYTDKNGIEKEAVFGDIILWNDDKYSDIVGLLKEWIDNGISINMSCEYYYFNFEMKDGIEYIKSPIYFNAHTLLNSEDRGDMLEVLPAYECATLISLNQLNMWNKAVSQLNIKNSKNNKEESNKMENKFLKIYNELSLADIRYKIYYDKLAEVMTAKEYEYVYVYYSDIYETYFLYENYEDEQWVMYKVPYTKNGDDITIDYESKQKVEGKYEYVAVEDVQQSANELKETKENLEKSENSLKEANDKINELNEKIISLNSKVAEKSNNEKNKTSELEKTIEELNKSINSMKPIVDKYNEEEFNKRFEKANNEFKEKFKNANCLEIFEEEDTQKLIKEYANSDNAISENAKNSLNSLIVSNMKPIVKEDEDDIMQSHENVSFNQLQKASKNEKLFKESTEDVYANVYGFKYDNE